MFLCNDGELLEISVTLTVRSRAFAGSGQVVAVAVVAGCIMHGSELEI